MIFINEIKFDNIVTIENIKKIYDYNRNCDDLFIPSNYKASFMAYRQFVRQGGTITFKDKPDFINEKYNGITLYDGSYQIVNDFTESKYHIFQVFYDQKSLDLCINTVGDYIPTLIYNEDTTFFENKVICDIYNNYKFKKSDYIGITSPIVTRKTLTTIDKLIEYSKGYDVLNYGNLHSIAGENLNVWKDNGNGRKGSNLFVAANELNNAKVLKFNIFKRAWTCIYCNYFICKVSIFDEYVDEVLIPSMSWLNFTRWIKATKETGLIHRDKWYPISVFLCECLFGSFLSLKNYSIKSLREVLPKSKILINQ